MMQGCFDSLLGSEGRGQCGHGRAVWLVMWGVERQRKVRLRSIWGRVPTPNPAGSEAAVLALMLAP